MSHIANREDVLSLLTAMKPGTSPAETIEQSTCVVFRNGFAHSFNEEVACKKKTTFPKDWEFAVPVEPVVAILTKIPDPEIEMEFTGKEMVVKGKGKRTGFTAQKDILLPLDAIKRPEKDAWKKLPDDFTDGIAIVESCAGRNKDEFISTCLHIHPKYVEATDRFQAARYKMKIDIDGPLLIRRESIEPALGFTLIKYAQTEGWLHFKTSEGLIYSVKENRDEFKDLSPFMLIEGEKIVLPKSLEMSSDLVEVFSKEDKDRNHAKIKVEPGLLTIRGEGTMGWHQEKKKVKYTGPILNFVMTPGIIKKVINRNNEVYLAHNRLIIDGGRWVYATVLGKPEKE